MTILRGQIAEFEFEITSGSWDFDCDMLNAINEMDGVEGSQPTYKALSVLGLGAITVVCLTLNHGIYAAAKFAGKALEAGMDRIEISGKATATDYGSIEGAVKAARDNYQDRRGAD